MSGAIPPIGNSFNNVSGSDPDPSSLYSYFTNPQTLQDCPSLKKFIDYINAHYQFPADPNYLADVEREISNVFSPTGTLPDCYMWGANATDVNTFYSGIETALQMPFGPQYPLPSLPPVPTPNDQKYQALLALSSPFNPLAQDAATYIFGNIGSLGNLSQISSWLNNQEFATQDIYRLYPHASSQDIDNFYSILGIPVPAPTALDTAYQ